MTGDWMKGRKHQKNRKCFVGPQYLVEHQSEIVACLYESGIFKYFLDSGSSGEGLRLLERRGTHRDAQTKMGNA
jgi:hypothetical protein